MQDVQGVEVRHRPRDLYGCPQHVQHVGRPLVDRALGAEGPLVNRLLHSVMHRRDHRLHGHSATSSRFLATASPMNSSHASVSEVACLCCWMLWLNAPTLTVILRLISLDVGGMMQSSFMHSCMSRYCSSLPLIPKSSSSIRNMGGRKSYCNAPWGTAAVGVILKIVERHVQQLPYPGSQLATG